MSPLYGGVEAGGTKFVCVVADEKTNIVSEEIISTSTPQETLSEVIDFFKKHEQIEKSHLTAIGVGSFGPLDLHPLSDTYGSITSTPKPGWADTPILNILKTALEIPIAIDTDVNTALLGEKEWGVGTNIDNLVYITIGTGIGGGAFTHGQPIHGLLHTEMGHMRIPHNIEEDPYPGCCPFHNDCWEGLASGPAIAERWGISADLLPPDHPAWGLEAHYIALGITNLICALSPQRIVLGGGVMKQLQLFPLIRNEVINILNGYIQMPAITTLNDQYIVPPKLGDRSGVLGAIALAMRNHE